MKFRVLGCSGGIGDVDARTTAFLVGHDILVDAGSGVTRLSHADMARVDHVFLTHAHIDHVLALPMLADAVGERRKKPLIVHALPEVLDTVRQHLFNGKLWPDFTRLPKADAPFIVLDAIEIGEPVMVDKCQITPLPVAHTVPAVGYAIDSGSGTIAFSGDTGPCDAFWEALNGIHNLRHLLIECAFPNCDRALAALSMHMCPRFLAKELPKLERACELWISHLKPDDAELTMSEIEMELARYQPKRLLDQQLIVF